jgi:hypothetical protein
VIFPKPDRPPGQGVEVILKWINVIFSTAMVLALFSWKMSDTQNVNTVNLISTKHANTKKCLHVLAQMLAPSPDAMTDTYTIVSRHPDGYIETARDVPRENVNRFVLIAEQNFYTVISVEKNEPDKYRDIKNMSAADRKDILDFAMKRYAEILRGDE